jgi:hypothetical protein
MGLDFCLQVLTARAKCIWYICRLNLLHSPMSHSGILTSVHMAFLMFLSESMMSLLHVTITL